MGTAQTDWLDADYGAGSRVFFTLSVRPGFLAVLVGVLTVAAVVVTL